MVIDAVNMEGVKRALSRESGVLEAGVRDSARFAHSNFLEDQC